MMKRQTSGAAGLSLSGVEDTALLTAACRARESERMDPILVDATAVAQLEAFRPLLATSELPLHRRIASGRIQDSLVSYISQRARCFDRWVEAFAEENPDGVVVTLGCGLDDRLGRIGRAEYHAVSVDLPKMIALRADLVPARPGEVTIGASILEPAWVEDVRERVGSHPVMLVAEGLLLYLEPEQVDRLLRTIHHELDPEALAFDVIHGRWTRGLLGRAAQRKMHRELGVDDSAPVRHGITDARDLCLPGTGWAVAGEWSPVDDSDARPAALRWFRGVDWVRRVQWAVLLRRVTQENPKREER